MRPWRPIFELAMLACWLGGAAIFAQERGIADVGGYVVADGTFVHDPAEAFAAEIAATLAGDPRNQQLRRIIERWATLDPAAAQLWVLGLPAGWGRDIALLTIVNSIASDSAHSAEIVNRILDERVRSAAAMNWVQSARARGGVDVEDFRARIVLSPASKAKLDALLPR